MSDIRPTSCKCGNIPQYICDLCSNHICDPCRGAFWFFEDSRLDYCKHCLADKSLQPLK